MSGSGQFNSPRITYDSSTDTLHAALVYEKYPDKFIRHHSSEDGGNTWSDAVNVCTHASTSKIDISVISAGNLQVVFTNNNDTTICYRSADSGASWEEYEDFIEMYRYTENIATGDEGKRYAITQVNAYDYESVLAWNGGSANRLNNYIKLNNAVSLTSTPTLEYKVRLIIEEGYDYGYVDISADNGSTWETLKEYTGDQIDWITETIDLSSYINDDIVIRIRYTTDSSTYYSGIDIRDIVIKDSGSAVFTDTGDQNDWDVNGFTWGNVLLEIELNASYVYESSDDGESWSNLSTLQDSYGGRLLVIGNTIYLLLNEGTDKNLYSSTLSLITPKKCAMRVLINDTWRRVIKR